MYSSVIMRCGQLKVFTAYSGDGSGLVQVSIRIHLIHPFCLGRCFKCHKGRVSPKLPLDTEELESVKRLPLGGQQKI